MLLYNIVILWYADVFLVIDLKNRLLRIIKEGFEKYMQYLRGAA
jgi:hypothetical protein